MVVKIKHSHHLEKERQYRVPNVLIVSVADTNTLNVTFADDVVLTIEFDHQWFHGAYAPLADAEEFSTVEASETSLRWRCGASLCLTHLYSFALLGESVLLAAGDPPIDALIREASQEQWEAAAKQVEERLAPVFKALAAETTFDPIVTEADHRAALDRLVGIFPPKPGTPQQHEADILAEMIEEWEKKHIPVPLSESQQSPDLIAIIKEIDPNWSGRKPDFPEPVRLDLVNGEHPFDRLIRKLNDLLLTTEVPRRIAPIRTPEDNAAALKRLSAIFLAAPGTPERDEADILMALIHEWESRNVPMPDVDPIEMIKDRMKELGWTREHLAPILTSQEAERVLARQRAMTVPEIRWIHSNLRIPLECLIDDYPLVYSEEHQDPS